MRKKIVQQLESLAAAGVQQLPKLRKTPPPFNRLNQPASHLPIQGQTLFDDCSGSEISAAPSLEVLREEVSQCTLCTELAETRTQTVFGVGNPQARLCFVGEAPGNQVASAR